jgi:hypothetical protein
MDSVHVLLIRQTEPPRSEASWKVQKPQLKMKRPEGPKCEKTDETYNPAEYLPIPSL